MNLQAMKDIEGISKVNMNRYNNKEVIKVRYNLQSLIKLGN